MSSLGFEKDVELSPSSPTSSDSPSSTAEMGCLPFGGSPGRGWTSRLRSKMKKLFGRKHKEEETASDSSLGRNSRTPQNDNPYAQQNADSYTINSQLGSQGSQGSQSSYQQPLGSQSSFRTMPSSSGSPASGRPGLPSGPRSGTPSRQQPQNYGSEPPRYTGTPKSGSGYSDEKLGSSAGYGANRYDAGSSGYDNQSNNRYGSPRPGGYGGFDQSARDSTGSAPPPQYSATRPGGGWDAPGGQDEYINPEDMTEEQLEDAQVRDLKRQAHDIRQESKASVENSLMHARNILAMGDASEQRLDEQTERLDKIERSMDTAIARAKEGREGTSRLDRLNSTPFFVPVANKKNRLKQEESDIRREREDKYASEDTRRAQYERGKNYNKIMGAYEKPKLLGAAGKADKYTFEDDDGTEAADEEFINDGVDQLSGLVTQIDFRARSIAAKLDADPNQPKRIIEKTEKADDTVIQINAKLRTIN